jgi:hydroxymethylbilane synthase
MKDLRGNIETRLRKLYSQDFDAIVMARAALVRLGMQMVLYSVFDCREMVPAVGQGAIGVQIRTEDEFVGKLVRAVNHSDTYRAVTAERAFLYALDSGCQFPVGANAAVHEDRLEITGFVGSEDGKTVFTESHSGPSESPGQVGNELAGRLIDMGALRLLGDYRNGTAST